MRSGKHIYNGRRCWQASGGCHYAGTELACHVCIMHGGPNERHRSPNVLYKDRTIQGAVAITVTEWIRRGGNRMNPPQLPLNASSILYTSTQRRKQRPHMTHILADREQLLSRQYTPFPPPRFRPASTYRASQANRSTPCPRTRVVKQQQDRQIHRTPVSNMARVVVL